MPMLSWLEHTLLEERRALGAALAEKHAALLREVSPHLQGVEWTQPMPPSSCSIPRQAQDGDSQPTPPTTARTDIQPPSTCDMADEDRGQSIVVVDCDEYQPSDGLGASHHKGSNSHGQHREQSLSLCTGRETVSTENPFEDTKGGETVNGPFARLGQFIRGPYFETIFALLILANTLMMAVEAQYKGIDIGWKVGYPGSSSRASETWPGAADFFQVAELIFGTLFTIELVLKFIVLGKHFCSDKWNFIDTIIVFGWFLTMMKFFPMPIDPMLLRLARLMRLLRLLRLIRKIKLFDSLYLMTTAMRCSFSVLVWSIVVLALVLMLLALFLQSVLEVYIVDKQKPEAARLEVFMFYGSFARAMLTMFEITLGNWMPPCRALVENVSEWWMLFVLAHKVVIGFSVVTVITSVFIQETFKVATVDDKIMINSKERARRTHIKKVEAFFGQADQDGNGSVDVDEFSRVLADAKLRTWLGAMGLEVRDTTQLFKLLDANGDGQIHVNELVDGISRLKGTATSYDLMMVEKGNMKLMEDVQRVQNQLKRIEDRLMA